MKSEPVLFFRTPDELCVQIFNSQKEKKIPFVSSSSLIFSQTEIYKFAHKLKIAQNLSIHIHWLGSIWKWRQTTNEIADYGKNQQRG
jgi:hypothetical protein